MLSSRILRKEGALANRARDWQGASAVLPASPNRAETQRADRRRPAAVALQKATRMNGFGLSRRAIRPALLGDAGRRGGQYGDAVAAAGDRPRARRRRHLGRGRLQPVGGGLGGDGAVLGAPRRPPRPARADAARPLRLHRLDADLRRRARRRPSGGLGATAVFVIFMLGRTLYGAFGSASPPAVQAYVAARTEGAAADQRARRARLLVRARHDHRPGDRAAFHLPAARPVGAADRLRRRSARSCSPLLVLRLPDDTPRGAGARRRSSPIPTIGGGGDAAARRGGRARRGCAGAIRASCPGT